MVKMQNDKKTLHLLNFLKVIAILLVFNSHCGDLYPNSVFATGGALGNSLFFVLSGYFLKLDQNTRFGPWIKKRFLQLYPGMLMVSLINALVFWYFPGDVYTFVYRFIWPTGYWFVGGLFLFNVVIYFLEKKQVFNKFFLYSTVLWAIYFVWYILWIDKSVWSVEEHGFFRLLYYFYIYSVGYCIKSKKITVPIGLRTAVAGTLLGVLGNLGWKLILVKVPGMMVTQFLCQIFCVLWAICAITVGIRMEEGYCRFLPDKFRSVMDFWSRYSLEIYFSQRLAQRFVVIWSIVFPLNMLIAILISLLYALLIKKVLQICKCVK